MPVLEGPVEIKASKAELVYSEHGAVDSGKRRGWVPIDECTFDDSAPVVSVRSLKPSELRRYRDKLGALGYASANRAATATGVYKARKGSREWKGADLGTFLDWLETRDALASDLLAEYIITLSNGQPLEGYDRRAKLLIGREGDDEPAGDEEERDDAASKSASPRAD